MPMFGPAELVEADEIYVYGPKGSPPTGPGHIVFTIPVRKLGPDTLTNVVSEARLMMKSGFNPAKTISGLTQINPNFVLLKVVPIEITDEEKAAFGLGLGIWKWPILSKILAGR